MIPHLYESPPTRASNPLIHDVQFNIHKKKVMPSPLFPNNFAHNSCNDSSCKKSSCGTSYASKQPFVRIEGFCSSTTKAHWGVIAFDWEIFQRGPVFCAHLPTSCLLIVHKFFFHALLREFYPIQYVLKVLNNTFSLNVNCSIEML